MNSLNSFSRATDACTIELIAERNPGAFMDDIAEGLLMSRFHDAYPSLIVTVDRDYSSVEIPF